jgi:hypothetical protein
MRMAALLVMIVAIVLQTAAVRADIRVLGAIPDAYWGRWSLGESCKDGNAEAIVLSAKTYAGPLGQCEVASVTETASPKGSIYSARLLCSGSDKAKEKSPAYLIIRPDDANRISVGPGFTNTKAYQRCLESAPASK